MTTVIYYKNSSKGFFFMFYSYTCGNMIALDRGHGKEQNVIQIKS